jgi:hypothetical protein
VCLALDLHFEVVEPIDGHVLVGETGPHHASLRESALLSSTSTIRAHLHTRTCLIAIWLQWEGLTLIGLPLEVFEWL